MTAMSVGEMTHMANAADVISVGKSIVLATTKNKPWCLALSEVFLPGTALFWFGLDRSTR
jgi:hypothetical protein